MGQASSLPGRCLEALVEAAMTVMTADRLTLRCRWLVTMAGPPLDNAWLVIERGRIAAVGRRAPPGPAGQTIDLDDAIVLPGLVNAHTHLEFSELSQPLDTGGGLPAWITRVVAERQARLAGSEAGAGADAAFRRGLAESAAAGVTTSGEIATTVRGTGFGPAACGPRPAVRIFREGLGLRPHAAETVPRAVAADLDRLAGAGIATGVSPHAPYSVAAPLGRRLLAEAHRRRLPVAMHLLESVEEEELLATGGGRWPSSARALAGGGPASLPLPPSSSSSTAVRL